MLSMTHLSVGIASSLLLLHPKTKEEIFLSVSAGAIGGVMADIDVNIDLSFKNRYAGKYSLDALIGELLAIAITGILLCIDYFQCIGICSAIANRKVLAITGGILLIVLIAIGKLSEHRKRTHSLLFLGLSTIAIWLIYPGFTLPFMIGYGSHLILDLLNKSPEKLLYPVDKGFCLKICYADRIGNALFMCLAVLMIVLYFAGFVN